MDPIDSRAADAARPDTAADRERLLERVRKLYAMSRETESSPHEAEIALRRCQSLMMRFGITENDLETSAFGSGAIRSGRIVPMHAKLFGIAVAELHDVLFVTGGSGPEFRGYDIDAQTAVLTHGYLMETVDRALASRKRSGDFPPGRSAAYDYRVAFAREVMSRVRRLMVERQDVERAARADGRGTSLIVRKREIVERECGQGLRRKVTRTRGPMDVRAADAGRRDGARVSLDPQVGTGSRRSLS